VLTSIHATVVDTNLEEPLKGFDGGYTTFNMSCHLEIDGKPLEIHRELGNEKTFDHPRDLFGMRVWFDANEKIFEFLTDDHGGCRPGKAARLAVWDASDRICPVLVHPWCPLPPGGLDIRDSYQGADCWCGAYFGSEAHGGLDINHPVGTPLWAPISFESQGLFDAVAAGDNNNRWRGTHRWADGSRWVLQVHHVADLRVKEGSPVEAGTRFADAAGVRVGYYEHSHFVFKVIEPEASEPIALDPWLLFRQMYLDRKATLVQ
jgi:hypothetical protein